MIEEIVNNIMIAEEQADTVIKESYIKGRDIVLNAEKEAEKKLRDAFKEIKIQSEESENKLFEELESRNTSFIETEKRESEERYNKKLLSIEKFADMVVEKYKKSAV